MYSYTNNLNNIIKCSQNCIVYIYNNFVYKQYKLYSLKWIREINIINYIHYIYNEIDIEKYIIKFLDIKIIRDKDYIYECNNIHILDNINEYITIKMNKYNDLKYESSFDKIFTNLLIILLINNSLSIMHRDFKENNILKNKNNYIMIDYGLSIINFPYNKLSSNVVTETHRPPELYYNIKKNNFFIKYNIKICVWSFGITLLNVFSNNNIYNCIAYGNNYSNIILNHDLYINYIKDFLYNNVEKEYSNIILDCLNKYKNRLYPIELYNKYKYKFCNIDDLNVILRINNENVERHKKLCKNKIGFLWINKIHYKRFDNNFLLKIFYKLEFIFKEKCKHINRDLLYISLYLLILYTCTDLHIDYKYYINLCKEYINNYKYLSQKNIEKCIIEIFLISDFNIYNNILK
jgi:serine/threonine protein kinase